jgi:hypothetical protein
LNRKLSEEKFTCKALLAIIAVVFSCALLKGCARGGPQAYDHMMITRQGDYQLDSQGLTLNVFKSADGLLHYRLVQSTGVELLKSSRGMSSFSRWFMQWQPDAQRLWVHSSDIGTVVWLRDASGAFREKAVSEDATLISKIPSEFYGRLPRVLKAKWPRVEQ